MESAVRDVLGARGPGVVVSGGFITATTSTSSDPPAKNRIDLQLQHDGEVWIASDRVGLRYGAGNTITQAVSEWERSVVYLFDIDRKGDALIREADRYRRALGRVSS